MLDSLIASKLSINISDYMWNIGHSGILHHLLLDFLH